MEISMESLTSLLDEKLNKQAMVITTCVTKNVMEALDEKMKIISEENNALKTKVSELENKLKYMENEKRKNNLIFFGIQETIKTELELVDYIKDAVIETGTQLDSHEISKVYRIGKQVENKTRPVVASITTSWKKHLIQRNKSSLPHGIYVKEDYSKEMLEKRKQLQVQVEEEKKKGNTVYLKYDKIVVKKNRGNNAEKRKREESGSPIAPSQKKTSITTPNKQNNSTPKAGGKDILRPNMLHYVERGRANSVSESSKN